MGVARRYEPRLLIYLLFITLASRRGDAGTLTITAEVLGFLLPAEEVVIQFGDTVGKGRDRRSVGFCCRRRSRL
jgi:hypothetical protein